MRENDQVLETKKLNLKRSKIWNKPVCYGTEPTMDGLSLPSPKLMSAAKPISFFLGVGIEVGGSEISLGI